MGNDVHNRVKGVFGFLRVKIRGVVVGQFGSELLEFRNGDLAFDQGTRVLESSGKEHSYCCVKKRDPPADFAGQGMEVRWSGTALPAGVGSVFAGAKAWDRVTQSEGGNTLELCV